MKFRAYVNKNGFLNELTDGTGLPADPNAAGVTDAQKAAIKSNTDAVCAYTMALTGDEFFNIIPESSALSFQPPSFSLLSTISL